MKAQINIFLNDDNSIHSVVEGAPNQLANMLYQIGNAAPEVKAAIYSAVHLFSENEGDNEMADRMFEKVEKALEKQ